ncbi:MAG: hypothetical protein PHE55_06820 [Methylococcaceae bacterium]|nr:hypothetical protein [Methylococcaceae bacterium]
MKRLFALVLAVSCVWVVKAQAHEGRCVKKGGDDCYYLIFVGFKTEPAFANEVNALDFLIKKNVSGTPQGSQATSIPDIFSNDHYAAVDVSGSDKITNASVTVLHLKSQKHVTSETDPDVIKRLGLRPYDGYDMPDMGMPGVLVHSMDPNYNYEYTARFMTGPVGAAKFTAKGDIKGAAYGFHIQATINGDAIDEYFVCGAGSTNPTGDAFSCVYPTLLIK